MLKKSILGLAVLTIVMTCGMATVYAQESSTSTDQEKKEKPVTAYRLNFSMHEIENGKTVNTRQYSMNLIEGVQWEDLKIGTRIPVDVKQGEMQYIDVGTNISAQLREIQSRLVLTVHADLSNLANPDQESRTSMPLIRQLQIKGSTVVTEGKPTVIGIADDPNSKRQFELEVIVEKIK